MKDDKFKYMSVLEMETIFYEERAVQGNQIRRLCRVVGKMDVLSNTLYPFTIEERKNDK